MLRIKGKSWAMLRIKGKWQIFRASKRRSDLICLFAIASSQSQMEVAERCVTRRNVLRGTCAVHKELHDCVLTEGYV